MSEIVQIYRDQYVYGPGRRMDLEFRQQGPMMPSRKTSHAAGYDVYAFLPEPASPTITIAPLQTVMVPTGLYFALPEDAVMLICSRSGLASKGLMVANGPGILDSDYRGELRVLLTYVAPPNADPFIIKHGDRIAQLLFLPASAVLYPILEDVHDFSELRPANSNRMGGFGSTGR